MLTVIPPKKISRKKKKKKKSQDPTNHRPAGGGRTWAIERAIESTDIKLRTHLPWDPTYRLGELFLLQVISGGGCRGHRLGGARKSAVALVLIEVRAEGRD